MRQVSCTVIAGILRRVASLPICHAVTVGNDVRTAGVVAPQSPPAVVWDDQIQLHIDLIDVMTRDIPSVAHVLSIIALRLAGPCGLRAASVFTLDPDDGSLTPDATHGDVAGDDITVAGRVFRAPAGAPPVVAGHRTAVRLRIGGRTLGVLVLTGSALAALRPYVAGTIALQLASTLQVLEADRHHQHVAHAATTIRRLFEEGTSAMSVEDAGRLLATATGEAFRTERAAVHLIGPDGRIRYATGVGMTERMSEELTRNLVGKVAADSPVWQAMLELEGPLLVGDVERTRIRAGGFVETLDLRSFIAMPLLSASGPAGMVMCGNSGTRHWSGRDQALARQVAMEGALIVDSARLRQSERRHVTELTRQAYHDGLTGLPNRSQLLDRASQEVEIAMATGARLALLLLDLDGFKKINDTVGHHAGDLLLQAVGHRLQSVVRDHDVVARLGGDEFAVLLARNPDVRTASAIAARLHARLCDPYDIDGREIRIGASIGIALFPSDADDMTTLMRGADAAMYRAKREGGGVRIAGG
ncbi:sensor domain-containing diguanylate cyclase [Actinoplanes friuliensis]|uniref:Putative membrane protein in llm 5'region n=1 Tax=Actinoplanes friuliensis DSM 7358 TaxID=1246995 RepID=U5W720_9ACTN|nr:sensor domain-containing diguanylate cyclase [Actinoplanes friuliensis]AGZ43731.1 putative membrane protein in llm 5'region [Actinoplanes friuliensis DSM 7358]